MRGRTLLPTLMFVVGLGAAVWLAGCGDDDDDNDENGFCRSACQKALDCGVPLEMSVDNCAMACEMYEGTECRNCIEGCGFNAGCLSLGACVLSCGPECQSQTGS